MSGTFRAGAASIVINNDLGTLIQGAGVPDQRVEAIRDDLEANALFLDDGTTHLLFVSCDLVAIETARVRRYTQAMAAAAGIDAAAILIGCSHTHGGPVMLQTDHRKPVDETYSQRLQEWLCTVAKAAVAAAAPARLGWGIGTARLGYNRRVCYADSSHAMYRRLGKDDIFTGVEGPDDTRSLALAVFDEENRIQAVLHHGTGHPDAFYAQRVLSSDFPGMARRLVREAFHAVRIGDLVLATNPFELFCQYQVDLKRRSPAASTVWFGLTDGYGGYLPTLAAALGGGYSGAPFAWARFAPEVGCRVVDTVAALLHDVWKDEKK